MSGDHSHSHGHDDDHQHGRRHLHTSPELAPPGLARRAFLGEYGRRTLALAIFTPMGLAACSDDSAGAPSTTTSTTSSTSGEALTADDTTTTAADEANSTEPELEPLQWARADLGFVSAYVLARGNEAAIVDTGSAGSASAIGETLGSLGLDYSDVAHLFLTHNHPDHIGSTGEVLAMAENATTYVGVADAAAVPIDNLTAVTGGEDIFGIEVLATPGHTAGHIAVIDHGTGLLVAGDALQSGSGVAIGPHPDFSADIDAAHESVRRLAELSFNTLLVGHGEPIEDGADQAVAALAATL